MLEVFDAQRLNRILGQETFKGKKAHNDEVKEATGLEIAELLKAYIFSSRNNFARELRKWQKSGQPMSLEAIWQKSA